MQIATLWLLFLCAGAGAGQDPKPVLIGLDGEFGHISSTSAEAIRQGMQIAIDEVNHSGGSVLRALDPK